MGLFDSLKKSDNSGLPKELENLLNMVLENGEISDDEMAVLRAKAEKFDISAGELDIIIKNRLLKLKTEEKADVQISLDEVNEKLSANLYDAADSYARLVEKYNTLLDLSAMPMDGNLKTKVHNAKMVFISSIVMPETKEGVIDLLSHTAPYSKTTFTGDVLKTLSSVGTFATKTLIGSVGIVSSIATLGKSKDVINKTQGVVTKAMTTNEMEEIDAWKKKLLEIIKEAKKMAGNALTFNKDKDFSDKLDAFAKQIKG